MKKISANWMVGCVLAFTACSSEQSEVRPDSTAISPAPASLSPSNDTLALANIPKQDWTVSETGIGPIRAGMTLKEANELLPGLATAEATDNLATAPCTYARSPSLPSGVVLMFENGRIARVDVLTGSSRTAEGAGIGDTEGRLQSLYENRLVTTPHKYTDEGHYLIVESRADSTRKIVFETDGYKVLRFRSGKAPAVEYVEGCG